MYPRRNLISFSKLFLIVVSVIYFALSIADSALIGALDLRPSLFNSDYQYWRLLTFAFVPGSVASYLLFLSAFYVFAPKIEGVFRRNVFPLFLLLLIVFQGIGLSIAFWDKPAVFKGMDGLSIFLIAFFTLMYPNSRIMLMNSMRIRTVLASSAIMVLWFASAVVKALYAPELNAYASLAYSSFGFIVALVFYGQLLIVKKLRSKRRYKRILIPDKEELMMALAPVDKMRNNEAPAKPVLQLLKNPKDNEDILNEILDKISSQGETALSLDEKKFLEDYSKQL